MTYEQYLKGPAKRSERRYWFRLINKHSTIAAVAKAAGCNRSTVYERMRFCGIPRDRQNRGNQVWQNLDLQAGSFFAKRFKSTFVAQGEDSVPGRIQRRQNLAGEKSVSE